MCLVEVTLAPEYRQKLFGKNGCPFFDRLFQSVLDVLRGLLVEDFQPCRHGARRLLHQAFFSLFLFLPLLFRLRRCGGLLLLQLGLKFAGLLVFAKEFHQTFDIIFLCLVEVTLAVEYRQKHFGKNGCPFFDRLFQSTLDVLRGLLVEDFQPCRHGARRLLHQAFFSLFLFLPLLFRLRRRGGLLLIQLGLNFAGLLAFAKEFHQTFGLLSQFIFETSRAVEFQQKHFGKNGCPFLDRLFQFVLKVHHGLLVEPLQLRQVGARCLIHNLFFTHLVILLLLPCGGRCGGRLDRRGGRCGGRLGLPICVRLFLQSDEFLGEGFRSIKIIITHFA